MYLVLAYEVAVRMALQSHASYICLILLLRCFLFASTFCRPLKPQPIQRLNPRRINRCGFARLLALLFHPRTKLLICWEMPGYIAVTILYLEFFQLLKALVPLILKSTPATLWPLPFHNTSTSYCQARNILSYALVVIEFFSFFWVYTSSQTFSDKWWTYVYSSSFVFRILI